MSNLGIEVWCEGSENASVDILFVHGLRGGRESTWTKDDTLWPKELLSKDIPDARIIGYGYDSGIVHADSAEVMQGSVEHDAKTLCQLLQQKRVETETTDRPIITVGHSLGGLVLAQVVYGGDRAAQGESLRSISDKVAGMLFLGTPFYGSTAAKWGDAVRNILDIIQRETDRNTLKNLKPNSLYLKPLRDGFPEVIRKRNLTEAKIGVIFCFEKLKLFGVLVVPEENARYPGVGEVVPVGANHRDICKFSDEEDDKYKLVKAQIMKLIAASKSDGSEKEGKGRNVTVNIYGKVINSVAEGDININHQEVKM